MKKVLCIIPYRALNQYREKNLEVTLQWFNMVKLQLDLKKNKPATAIDFDIIVVEQDSESHFESANTIAKHIFLFNKGVFNKGWAFNVVCKQYPDYDYYLFADGDIIFPDIKGFCNQIITHCLTQPQPAFRLFKQCLDTCETDRLNCSTIEAIINGFDNKTLKLVGRCGLTFAGGVIAISRQTYEKVGGWEEEFEGWGRHDDFMTLKLLSVGQCKKIISPLDALHLWHPITADFSLTKEIILLYNRYSQLNPKDLGDLIKHNQAIMGNPLKYSLVGK